MKNENKLALIFGNGTYENIGYYLEVLSIFPEAYIVAVDGGYDILKELNVIPNIVVGDLDSVKRTDIKEKIIQVKPEKDETDTRLAIDYLVKEGFKTIMMLGMSSLSRLDHTLVNIFLLEKYAKQGIDLILSNSNATIICRIGPDKFNLGRYNGLTISFIPLSKKVESLTLSGVKYPLNNVTLERINPDLTVSNIVQDENSYLEFKKGSILIIANTIAF